MIRDKILGASSAGGFAALLDTVQGVITGLIVYLALLAVEKLKTKIHTEKKKRKNESEG